MEVSSSSFAALRNRRRVWLTLAVALVLGSLAAQPASAKGGENHDATPNPSLGAFDQWEAPEFVYDGVDYNPADYPGSMYWVNQQIGAARMWEEGFTGAGIDIALIDTGVAPVDGLRWTGKVVDGADLSFDSQLDGFAHLDAYGHGTHLAGIMAGRSDGAATISRDDTDNFLGVAPEAGVLNVKVADASGAVDVSQVIAAIDWVIEHRNDNGMNVRVMTLAYGTNSVQSYEIDPLAHAVERAWRAGIVVVVAGGNDGNDAVLRNPAADPFVISVGASENEGKWKVMWDDTVTEFSNCGTSTRRPDIVAPGRSIISLRNSGSVADANNPEARMGDDYFVGSGTSQAAAVVSGAVALLLDQRPELTPDQVKELIVSSAKHLRRTSDVCQGAGSLSLKAARPAETPSASASDQAFTPANGTGSLEAARGEMHVFRHSDQSTEENPDLVALQGEIDIMGSAWTGYSCQGTVCESLWDDGDFNGATWTGSAWSGGAWLGASWSGASWSGASWSGASWSGASWSGASWSGASWSGASWSGASWSDAAWSSQAWR